MRDKRKNNHIAIVWDFDKTLCPIDSTTKTVEILLNGEPVQQFWDFIHSFKKDTSKDWEHILASDAPSWMYSLSRLAHEQNVPLNTEFFKNFVLPSIKLFPNVLPFLKNIKSLSNQPRYKAAKLEIHHFVVSAGLKDLIELVFPPKLITYTFGCRYEVVASKQNPDVPENIPVFCMDETMKTRSIFEITKGSFSYKDRLVNTRVEPSDLWAPFSNVIYVGDGPTDIPALSLTRYNGGTGIVVYDPSAKKDDVEKRLDRMRLDKRADLITPANYRLDGELYNFIQTRCLQICQRYEAELGIY